MRKKEKKGMVTMVDEIFDRHYQEGRHQLNAALGDLLGRLASAISNSFRVLNRIEYSAPWQARPKHAR
jgi:hypothetical protein